MDLDRLPVVVATGQVSERDRDVTPLELFVRASEHCFEDARALRDKIDVVSVVNVLSDVGPSPAGDLAALLGIHPRKTETTTVGGNAPQWLVSRAADAISQGALDVALIVGGEAQRSKSRERRLADWKRKESGVDRTASGLPDDVVGDDRAGFGQAELSAGLLAPVHVYPLFDSVIAHRTGRSFEEHRGFLGQVMAPLTTAAAHHRCAWFPFEQSAKEISHVTQENRLVSEPYPKKMCAFLGVDQASAVIVCSYRTAHDAGLGNQVVFCWSGADAAEVWFPTSRPDPGSLPGFALAASAALDASSIGVSDIAMFDLYSCFPCVLEMACDALGVSTADERGLSVTGGLPYFGGPGNAYTLFGIATMVEKLRDTSVAKSPGLVSGIGWYATKHAVGIYGTAPPPDGWRRGDTSAGQREIDATTLDVALEIPERTELATVTAATVSSNNLGEISGAPVIATLADGRRIAAAPDDSVTLSELAGVNLVGSRIAVGGSPPRYRLH